MVKEPNDEGSMHVVAGAVAPGALTAEQRIVQERERRVRRSVLVFAFVLVVGLAASHLVLHISNFGAWLAVAVIVVVNICLSLLGRSAGISPSTSPLRGILLLWLAISVALVVLVSLDSFSGENMLLLAVAWGGLLLLWLADRALWRLLRHPKSS